MPDDTYTAEEKRDIKRAIASGVKQITHEGKTTIFRSLDEMRAIVSDMDDDLTPTNRRRRRVIGQFDRGI